MATLEDATCLRLDLYGTRYPDERRQAYWQLYQLNTALGIPMPTMEALGVPPLAVNSRLPHGRARSDG